MAQCAGCSAQSWHMMVHLLFLLLLSVSSCSAQLSRDEKQLILDLHNYYRASSNAAGMRRMVGQSSFLGGGGGGGCCKQYKLKNKFWPQNEP